MITEDEMPHLEIHYAEEWAAALYVEGRLEQVGDAYLLKERALKILGVKIVHDNAFMLGQGGRAGVAKTLDQVRDFTRERDFMRERARREARALALEEDVQAAQEGIKRA